MSAAHHAPTRVLVIDDDAADVTALRALLEGQGYRVNHTPCGLPSIDALLADFYDIVLLCACGPGRAGMYALAQAQTIQLDAQFIILADDKSVDTAVDAMKLGAFDYVTKPYDTGELLLRVDRALEMTQLRRAAARARRDEGGKGLSGIVGNSAAMRRVFELIEAVAPTHANVLLLGETGTGKGLVAQVIHRLSLSHKQPFVPVSCSALPDALLESELFGHKRGSFTGAVSDRTGLFEQARGGTVFLDEIETLNLLMQAKLLRVIEERTIQRIGGGHDVRVDFRLVAASNADLEQQMRQGMFRDDLFYRLNVYPITLPPLRDRRDDIPLLATHFRDHFEESAGVVSSEISPDIMERLKSYDWPGNVRELRNCIERAVILSAGRKLEISLPPTPTLPFEALLGRPLAERWSLRRLQSEYVRAVLYFTKGHRNRAAEILGIDRRTLYRKARELSD